MNLTTGSLMTHPRRHWLLLPPGVLFYLAVAFAVLQGVWVSSLQSFVGLIGTVVVWFSLAGLWAFRLLGAAIVARLRFSVAEWARWLGVPLILGVVYLWTQTGAPYELRLSLSRPAMDQAAAEIIAGGSIDRDWIGLWPVDSVERLRRHALPRIRVRHFGCGFHLVRRHDRGDCRPVQQRGQLRTSRRQLVHLDRRLLARLACSRRQGSTSSPLGAGGHVALTRNVITGSIT